MQPNAGPVAVGAVHLRAVSEQSIARARGGQRRRCAQVAERSGPRALHEADRDARRRTARTRSAAAGWPTSADLGVVDHRGEVFGYEGLYCIDSSIDPDVAGRQPVADDRRRGRALRRAARRARPRPRPARRRRRASAPARRRRSSARESSRRLPRDDAIRRAGGRKRVHRPARRLRYGEHRDQVAELFLPPGDGPFALVCVMHGGWWQARRTRTKLYTRPLSADLVRHGFAVLNAEYRRVGAGGGWPATFDDARAIAALGREQPEASGVALLGHSAGAHLALYAAAEGGADAVVALAAPSDLEAKPGPETRALMGGGPDEVPERYALGSPVRRVPLGVPALLVHGTRDEVGPVRSEAATSRWPRGPPATTSRSSSQTPTIARSSTPATRHGFPCQLGCASAWRYMALRCR